MTVPDRGEAPLGPPSGEPPPVLAPAGVSKAFGTVVSRRGHARAVRDVSSQQADTS
ncbi:hypothetical protein [Streptosporangium sp. NBC_01469]|uniref:hypothetical protein n=1 Tax=Streptosporangium sp. NBC_01469 TaxID=2903898 RepID=UPI002E281164|nr:hypothetical protein [Streptosporangium sp. NBC_01469]